MTPASGVTLTARNGRWYCRNDRMRRSLPLFLVAATLVTSFLARTAEAVESPRLRIVDLTTTTEVMAVAAPMPSLGGTQLRKFTPETVPAWMAVVGVTWETIGGGTVPGARLLFQYKINNEPATRSIEARVERAAAGRRSQRFAVPLGMAAENRVTAWRLQLVQGGRVIDERRSASWK